MRTQGEGTLYEREDNGRWVAMINLVNDNGKRVRKSKTVATKKLAEAALKELRAQYAGIDPDGATKTVGELLRAWLEFKSTEISKATADQYRYAVVHLTKGLGDVLLTDLRPQRIDTFLRKQTTLSPRYRKLLRTILSMALDQGVNWQLVSSNAAKFSAKIKQPETEGRGLTETQAQKLLEAAKGDRLEALWIIMLMLGLRRGEALGLEWSDYDEARKILSISRQLRKDGSIGELKTRGSKRTIPVPAPVADALEAHRTKQEGEKLLLAAEAGQWASAGTIFTSGLGTYLDPDNVSHYFKRLANKAGLGDWHIHELRHSAATFMLVRGVPLEVVADILGHSSIRITADTYGHLTTERLKVGAEAMEAVFRDLSKSATEGQL